MVSTERMLLSVLVISLVTQGICNGSENPAARQHFRKGNKHERKGALDAALTEYNRAIEIDASFEEALFSRGFLHLQFGSLDLARTDLSRVIEINPENSDYFYTRSLIELGLQDLNGAEADISMALKFHPPDAQLRFERGRIRFQREDFEGAVQDLNMAEKLNSEGLNKNISRLRAADADVGFTFFAQYHVDLAQYPLRVGSGGLPTSNDYSRAYARAKSRRESRQTSLERLQSSISSYIYYIFFYRGVANLHLNEREVAFIDIGKFLEVAASPYRNAIFEYLKGNYEAARQSFESLGESSSDGLLDYVTIWEWFTLVRLGRIAEANDRVKEVLQHHREFGEEEPNFRIQIARYLLREFEFPELIKLAATNDPVEKLRRLFEATFYSAQFYLLLKNHEHEALLLLEQCLKRHGTGYFEYRVAAIQKEMLEIDLERLPSDELDH